MKALDTALITQLTTPATALYALVAEKVYVVKAPDSAAFPFVLLNVQAGGDTNDTPVDFVELVYQVKGLATEKADSTSIEDAIRARLHKQAFSVSGWTLVSAMRESEIQYFELVNNVPCFHAGGLYRFRLSK